MGSTIARQREITTKMFEEIDLHNMLLDELDESFDHTNEEIRSASGYACMRALKRHSVGWSAVGVARCSLKQRAPICFSKTLTPTFHIYSKLRRYLTDHGREAACGMFAAAACLPALSVFSTEDAGANIIVQTKPAGLGLVAALTAIIILVLVVLL